MLHDSDAVFLIWTDRQFFFNVVKDLVCFIPPLGDCCPQILSSIPGVSAHAVISPANLCTN